MANGEQVDHDRLRFVFVDMLFALAVGEVATHVSALVKADQTVLSAPSAWMNLALAFILITMSWVGWSNSEVMRQLKAATDVFSRSFLVLVIDVVLVIVYYVIAQGVEMPDPQANGKVTPSADNEASWVSVVFFLYILWDYVTKGYGDRTAENSKKSAFAKFWPRGRISMACFLERLLVWMLCWFNGAGMSAAIVVSLDAALLAVVVQFRAMKQDNQLLARGLLCLFLATSALSCFL